jgi:integrase
VSQFEIACSSATRRVWSASRRLNAPERQPLSAAEARTLLDIVRGDRLEALWVVELAAGMRRGEITGLGWPAVELEAGTVRVNRTLSYRPGDAYELGAPKTKRSLRTIRLPAIAVEALHVHRQRQREERLAAGANWRPDWNCVDAPWPGPSSTAMRRAAEQTAITQGLQPAQP